MSERRLPLMSNSDGYALDVLTDELCHMVIRASQ